MRSQGVGHFSEVLVDIGISGQRTITLDVVAVTEIQDLVDCATEKCLRRARRHEPILAKCHILLSTTTVRKNVGCQTKARPGLCASRQRDLECIKACDSHRVLKVRKPLWAHSPWSGPKAATKRAV